MKLLFYLLVISMLLSAFGGLSPLLAALGEFFWKGMATGALIMLLKKYYKDE